MFTGHHIMNITWLWAYPNKPCYGVVVFNLNVNVDLGSVISTKIARVHETAIDPKLVQGERGSNDKSIRKNKVHCTRLSSHATLQISQHHDGLFVAPGTRAQPARVLGGGDRGGCVVVAALVDGIEPNVITNVERGSLIKFSLQLRVFPGLFDYPTLRSL